MKVSRTEDEKLPFGLGHLESFTEHVIWKFFIADVENFIHNCEIEYRKVNPFTQPEEIARLQGKIEAAEGLVERIDLYRQELLADQEEDQNKEEE